MSCARSSKITRGDSGEKGIFAQPLGFTEQCLSPDDLVACFHNKDASKEQMERVERHLSQCAVCRENKAAAQVMFDRIK